MREKIMDEAKKTFRPEFLNRLDDVIVFRSLIKETRITQAGIELEMYVQPTQNVWWKYRQKKSKRPISL